MISDDQLVSCTEVLVQPSKRVTKNQQFYMQKQKLKEESGIRVIHRSTLLEYHQFQRLFSSCF